jgi:hypothetical protein
LAALASSTAAPADKAIGRSRTTAMGAKRMAAHPRCGRGGAPSAMRPGRFELPRPVTVPAMRSCSRTADRLSPGGA